MDSRRSSGRAAILTVVVIAACAVTAFLFLQDQEPRESSAGGDSSSPTAAGKSGAGTSMKAEGVRAGPVGPGDIEVVFARMTPAERAARLKHHAESPRGVAMFEHIAKLEALLKSEDAEEEKGDEAEEAWERAWTETIDALIDRASSPEFARLMRERMDATEDEAFATRLARILRNTQDPEFVAEMRERATKDESPLRRRMALLTLETKDAQIWYEPVVQAFTADEAPKVRDEAAGVFARSLIDRKHIRRHEEMRRVVAEQVARKDPEQRARALRTLLADRRAGPAQLELAKAHVDDPDPRVREEARRVVRVLGPRVKRLIDQRAHR